MQAKFRSYVKKMKSLIILALVTITVLISSGHAQIPRACTNETSLRDLTCCPATSDGVCGADAGRGDCVDLNLPNHSNSTTNVRINWPHYYTRACQCRGNYWGYDCSRCKFGYYGANCSQYQVLPRVSVATWTDADWTVYNNALRMTRTVDSGYVAVLEETYPGNTTLRTANLTIYGMFVWLHHYAAFSSLDPVAPVDYAHTGPAFYTWHRLHGLWMEWMIQNMLESMDDPNYHLFRLPYWDWRRESQRIEAPFDLGLGAEDLFIANRAGETRNMSGRPVVTGDLYGNGWETMCWFRVGQICDPTENTGFLQRCPFTGTNPCHSSNPDWPSQTNVLVALAAAEYDRSPYNIMTVGGFRAFVDFILGNEVTYPVCRTDRQCRCLPSLDPSCTNTTGQVGTQTSSMHLLGHIIPGWGDFNFILTHDVSEGGTIEDVAASPNDPFFILHHNMIDCMLVAWKRLHPGTEYPANVTNIGHARDGFVVPFFPLLTNNDLFVLPEVLGYTCDLPGVPGSAVIATMSVTWVLLLGALAIVFIQY